MVNNNISLSSFENTLSEIPNNAIIGLGTGRTVSLFFKNKLLNYLVTNHFVASSYDSEVMAKEHGIQVLSLSSVDSIDFYFDGADFIDPNNQLAIKGYGGALFKEKICYLKSKKTFFIVTKEKLSGNISEKLIPFEVHIQALDIFKSKLNQLGIQHQIRNVNSGKFGFAITENGFLLVDIKMEEFKIDLVTELTSLPGVLCHGIFYEREFSTLVIDI